LISGASFGREVYPVEHSEHGKPWSDNRIHPSPP